MTRINVLSKVEKGKGRVRSILRRTRTRRRRRRRRRTIRLTGVSFLVTYFLDVNVYLPQDQSYIQNYFTQLQTQATNPQLCLMH